MKNILVFGFYKNEPNYTGNIGDNLFKEAFRSIFPEYHLTFTDRITDELLSDKDGVFFGGGSFLDAKPPCNQHTFDKLLTMKVFYIGIGCDSVIHPWHQELLKISQFIFTRSQHYDKLKQLNRNVFYCPDLVYGLKTIKNENKDNSILILPNAYLISKYDAPAWKHLSWEYFKSEFSQLLDDMISRNYIVDFFPMCQSIEVNDTWAAIEIMGKMKSHKANIVNTSINNFSDFSKLISKYSLVISQRFHGLVLADMCNVPCINIHHHNKLKQFSSNYTKNIDYYGVRKEELHNACDSLQFIRQLYTTSIAISPHIFEEIQSKVAAIL